MIITEVEQVPERLARLQFGAVGPVLPRAYVVRTDLERFACFVAGPFDASCDGLAKRPFRLDQGASVGANQSSTRRDPVASNDSRWRRSANNAVADPGFSRHTGNSWSTLSRRPTCPGWHGLLGLPQSATSHSASGRSNVGGLGPSAG